MSAPAQPLEAFAPAKVNLTLHVGPPRADGYHPLHSLVVFADWGDRLVAEPSDALSLSLTGPWADGLRDDPHNLVLKAAWALRAAAGRGELGARLTLEKHLPLAAGLGGGSADAAAALRVLNDLWELDFSLRQLAEIASVVGADVPACIWSRPLVMEGIGEKITPLVAWPELHGLIANPGVAVSTPEVFRAFDAKSGAGVLPAASRMPVAGTPARALEIAAEGRNDLEASAIALQPVIGKMLATLTALPGVKLARMSGSGASAFAVLESRETAETAASALAGTYPDWRVQAVSFAGAAS